jgi:hypothetical protein
MDKYMERTILFSLFIFICLALVQAQVVYVDSNAGDDKNPGTKELPVFSIQKAAEIIKSKKNDISTMKINPGIYILDHHISIETEKETAGKRIVVEASILPDDSEWTPEKMPVIITRSNKGEIMQEDLFIKDNWITSFYINESHVTIKGLKFHGYNYPVNFYYPIARFNKEKTDLIIEQCMFLGDLQNSVIQAGIIAHGDSVKVDHCIFYKVNNAVVYWQTSGNDFKTGNSMTNCIISNTHVSAIWTASPDKDFIFKNNIVADCNFFWVKNKYITTKYSLDNCVIVNNRNFKADENLKPSDFELNETNVTKEGNISLRLIKSIFEAWPIDHLHIIPKTLGYNLDAGLFKKERNKI